jgi:hypothetical protein
LFEAFGVPPTGSAWAAEQGAQVTSDSARLSRLAQQDPAAADLVARLLKIAAQRLPQAYLDGEFVFTVRASSTGHEGDLVPSGRSLRYAAIVALGLLYLPEQAQRQMLAGDNCAELVGRLVKRLEGHSNLADAAVVTWAAAALQHDELDKALELLGKRDATGADYDTVAAAWVVSALAVARPYRDVEAHLARARERLLGTRLRVLFPHGAGGTLPRYRAHVGSFADQVYPLQALARLHASGGDEQALAVANAVARAICAAQGSSGQWWWHYDARTGEVVEGYPVYTVHQHAMAPMTLLDLAEAGGDDHLKAICTGLGWLTSRPETDEELVLDESAVTWRKVARADPKKLVRGARAAASRVRPGSRLDWLDRVFPAGTIDRECRPYELGWLLAAWLS